MKHKALRSRPFQPQPSRNRLMAVLFLLSNSKEWQAYRLAPVHNLIVVYRELADNIINMGLSARTDDFTGQPLGEGFITLSTSAGNALLFRDPASANEYRNENPAQFKQLSHGEFNTTGQAPAQD